MAMKSSLLPAGLLELLEFDQEFLAPAAQQRLDLSGHPTNEEKPEAETEEKPEAETEEKPDDWKAHSRKHEREAKKARQEADKAKAELKKLQDAGASDQEKALAKAKEEAKAEFQTEFEQERRRDRLELAATRAAGKGVKMTVKVKNGDKTEDKEVLVKFADPDDALVYVERAIAKRDVDADDIYDSEGKVKTDALDEALKEILVDKPHLRLTEGGRQSAGSADGGRGDAVVDDDLEDMSVDDHFKAVRKK